MNITIRHEKPEDYKQVESVTREAFWNLYRPGCSEHWIAHNIRTHKDYIPELSFVIELDGTIIGSIFYTQAKINASDNQEHSVISFGPVSILPEFHRKGFGRALIEHSVAEAKKLGYRAILIGGYPHHYTTYGFRGAKKYGISMPDGNYYTGIMALPLFDGALDGICGSVIFSKAMSPDESLLADFDSQFPPKEKLVQPCQQEFQKASTEIDTRAESEI